MISRNYQVNCYNIASIALFIACYCDNVMLVMYFNLMGWGNGKLAASKLIHCCSFHWFSLWEAAADGLLLRVYNIFLPQRSLCHCLAKQMEAVFFSMWTSVSRNIILLYMCNLLDTGSQHFEACTNLKCSNVYLSSPVHFIINLLLKTLFSIYIYLQICKINMIIILSYFIFAKFSEAWHGKIIKKFTRKWNENKTNV